MSKLVVSVTQTNPDFQRYLHTNTFEYNIVLERCGSGCEACVGGETGVTCAVCLPGWDPVTCDECDSSHGGDDCSDCAAGRFGDNCELSVVTYALVGGAVALVVALGCIVFLWRSRAKVVDREEVFGCLGSIA